MKVLGLIGSPRVDGNTTKLVNAILEGAAENGAETKVYNLSVLDINPCKGCMTCKIDGKCVVDDDMQQLYDEIQAADAVVLGSPIYMWEVTAQTKLFIDRLVAFLNPDFSTRLNMPKKLVLAFTQGNPNLNTFKQYFDYMEGLFSFMQFDVQSSIVAAGTYIPDDILQQPDVLAKAKEIGKGL
ncbi:MAG: flavodoxin family protein [Methanosarcina sp.]|uniref:flavodoxin family protein n=1 Tax=Methanosarcina sp. TaxID=2213 RepID=UPI0026315193|nr:flavodoxin family protein [Methanosarcina sp.]MDD3248144.1 flavodoxin family protein [Methanosarcina sp.]